MIKSVRIYINADFDTSSIQTLIQKDARSLSIEGSIQLHDGKIKIIACGKKDNIDKFIDLVHKEMAAYSEETIEVEPFLKDKDYRGVFRIIE